MLVRNRPGGRRLCPTVHGAILPSIRKTPYEQIEEPLGPSPNGLPRAICRTIEIDIRNA